MANINIKEILDLWFKLRDTQKEYLPIHNLSRANPWDYQVKRDMEQAFELDPDGLTALLLLDNFRTDFFDGCGISISDIIENPNFAEFILECKKLKDMLSAEEIVTALEQFMSSVSATVAKMQIDRTDVTEMLNCRYDIAILRRDALKSMQTLKMHQFYQGQTAMKHLTYLPDIHLFWNMNSLVRCAWQSADGVSINLIKDPLDTSSFFAFVAKNGGNLTIVTDKPREAHPLSKYMTRRPEKEFTNRIFRNHFPYGLLDIQIDKDGYARPGNRSLVPIQDKPIKIGSVAEMEPDEIIWTIMMFSLIDEKLYKENYQCDKLSYTSDMIDNPRIGTDILSIGTGSALMVQNYKPLEVPVIDTTSFEKDDQYSKFAGSGVNAWLYDRYKDQIPADVMNGLLPSEQNVMFLLPGGDRKIVSDEQTEKNSWNNEILLKSENPDYIETDKGQKICVGNEFVKGAVKLEKMSGDEFGSAEDLMKDYLWFARYNAAKVVQQKAQEEYQARKEEVKKWVKDRIQNNLDRIFQDVLRYKYYGEKNGHDCRIAMVEMNSHDTFKTYDAYQFIRGRNGKSPSYTPSTTACWFNADTPCGYLIRISPITVDDLLYLTGCETKDELPDVLQNWRSNGWAGETIGNSILDRIDPMDWVVKNPWGDLHFNVLLGVGKKHLAKVKKDLNIEAKAEMIDNNCWFLL